MIRERINALAADLKEPLLVVKKEHIFYLTGQFFKDGYVLVFPKADRKQSVFLGFGLESSRGLKSAMFRDLHDQLSGSKTLLVEDAATLEDMAQIKKLAKGVRCKAVVSPILYLREIKSNDELERMRHVAELTATVFETIKKKIKTQQWTEIGLARYIRIWGLELGADDVSFEPIVAAGENSAIPHHHPTERVLKTGEPIVLDFGFKVNGYCSDFTRTVFLKSAPPKMTEIYNHVEAAYLQSLQAMRSGMSGEVLDDVARGYLDHVKLGKYFTHSLGHGTGLEVHEIPYVSIRAENVLEDGMVFSIEPGVYIPKTGGVRIEDLVYVENGQAHRFVSVPTALTDNIIK